ncbi:MAG TPA: hypothetical protein VK986_15755, partial [Tepidisphaeraceae bacterium]|nr:hypothetical protein [Tepidisphaeraceae bacterium]
MTRPDVQWERQPAAEQLVRELVDDFLSRCPEAATLARRMRDETGTRFIDWVDHVARPYNDPYVGRLIAAGFRWKEFENVDPRRRHSKRFTHPAAVVPFIDLIPASNELCVAIRVESVIDFAVSNGLNGPVFGEPLAPARWIEAVGRINDGVALLAAERNGINSYVPFAPTDYVKYAERLTHAERFRTRRREWDNEEAGFDALSALLDASIADLGTDITTRTFFAAEREYWQRRNRAAQFQKAREDRLGLGWANHDHHTYRSSRRHFGRLIALWEKLGFELRERFYAGAEAGW